MRYFPETTALYGTGGTVATPGTVTGVGLRVGATYEPAMRAVVNVGISDGTVVAYLQGSNSLSTGYVSVGSITAAGAAAGTAVYSIDAGPDVFPYDYVRTLFTVAGGTAVVSSSILAKPRTPTA